MTDRWTECGHDPRYWILHDGEWLVVDEQTGEVVARYPSEAGAQEHCHELNLVWWDDYCEAQWESRCTDYGAPGASERHEAAWAEKRRLG